MLTPNPHFRIKIPEIIEILDNWSLIPEVKLNKVALAIKSNEEYMESGEY